MQHKTYREFKEEKFVRNVSITEAQAKRFNSKTKTTKLSYKLVEEKKAASTVIEIEGIEYPKSEVIDTLLTVGVELAKNTGVVKVTEAYEALEEEEKGSVQEELTKKQ